MTRCCYVVRLCRAHLVTRLVETMVYHRPTARALEASPGSTIAAVLIGEGVSLRRSRWSRVYEMSQPFWYKSEHG